MASLELQDPGYANLHNSGNHGSPLVKLPTELLFEIVKLLDADPDAKLSPLSLVNRFLRELSIPTLFRTMQLTTRENKLLEHIEDIEDNEAILDSVVVMGIYSEGFSTTRTPYQNVHLGHGQNCKRGTAYELAGLILSLPNLQDLRLDLRFKANTSLIGPLRRSFDKRYLMFPDITALAFPMKTDLKFIPEVFPNLRAISLELQKAPNATPDVRYLSMHLQLEYLELWKARWDQSDLQGIPTLFRHVTHLTIGGMMTFSRTMGSLTGFCPVLEELPNLRVLAITNDSLSNRHTRNVKAFDRGCRIHEKNSSFCLICFVSFSSPATLDYFSSSAMDARHSDDLAPTDGPKAQSVAPTAKTYLVTLPRELVIEIIKTCHETRPDRGLLLSSRYSGHRGSVLMLSCVNKCLRTLSIPFLFESLELEVDEAELGTHLKVIADNEAILEAARFIYLNTYGPGNIRCSAPCGAPTRALLVKVLSKMSLKELKVQFDGGEESLANLFCSELAAQRVTLPSVTVLAYPHYRMAELIPTVFSNLRVLGLAIRESPKKTPGLRAVATELHRLDTLELSKDYWDFAALEEIVELFPLIPRLLIDGRLRMPADSRLIAVFKKMTNLKELSFMEDMIQFQDPHDYTGGFALKFFYECPRLEQLLLTVIYFGRHIYFPVRKGKKLVNVEVWDPPKEVELGWHIVHRSGGSPWKLHDL
ncbi:F-box domain-containing protein [Colletotrichum zoysiae]|uniref:F-box domain-containing protein n=1 Tax=Colletotrichum zoysiae TaxID=1216348 RepID=A0AAD9LYU4_9PEZI|nr:F-box domain-containing protein [Colletotrichum zoysiae]